MPPYLLGYNLQFLKRNTSFLHILVVFGGFVKFSCVDSNFEIGTTLVQKKINCANLLLILQGVSH